MRPGMPVPLLRRQTEELLRRIVVLGELDAEQQHLAEEVLRRGKAVERCTMDFVGGFL